MFDTLNELILSLNEVIAEAESWGGDNAENILRNLEDALESLEEAKRLVVNS